MSNVFRMASTVVIGLSLSASAATLPVSAAETPLVLGQIDVSFYAATGAVVQEVLERLGHPVTVRAGTHNEIFPLLAAGKVDLLVAVWLPHAHKHLWEEYGGDAFVLATLYRGARLFWAVPEYVPESDVASIADLAKSDVAARMIRTLQGIGPKAGTSVRSLKAIAAYGLDKAGYKYRFGTWQDRHRAVESAVRDRRWIVVSMAAPMFLNRAYALRPLADPLGIFGQANEGMLAGHKSLTEKVPQRTLDTLRRIRLGLEAVNELDYLVVLENRTPHEAARLWMAQNADTVQKWFTED